MEAPIGSRRWIDGNALLREIVASSRFGSVEQAVASLSAWSHPDTVGQTANRPLFLCVRTPAPSMREQDVALGDGRVVMYDDNMTPTEGFLLANGLVRGDYRDVHFNHVWTGLGWPGYTTLANLCVTPTFLAKLTDTDAAVIALLQYRVYDLYGWAPKGTPKEPSAYRSLDWAAPLAPCANLESAIRARLRGTDNRLSRSIRRLGWLFSDYLPDPTL